MTIEQITQLKGLGYTAEEIALLAPSISDPAMPAAPAADPAPAPDPAPATPANDNSNSAVLDAINKLTESIQANNRGQQGTGAAPAIDTSTIFDTIINGINKKG